MNIRRSNIKMATYVNLQKQFNDCEIPVYGEMILGLPGETSASWRRGLDELLEAGTRNQLFIYWDVEEASFLRLTRDTDRFYGGDTERFARESILWGRKSGTMLVKCTYGPAKEFERA